MRNALASMDRTLRPRGTVFYGWWIVLAAAGIQWLAAALWMHSYGAYMVLLQDEFGWSKALVAGAFALTRIEAGLLAPLQGWLADRFGPRSVLTVGTVLFALGFVLFSMVDSIPGFYVTCALIAIGSTLGGFPTLTVALVNWFDRHRSKAVALSQIGFSVGGISVPLVIVLLEALGWRTTSLISALVVLVVGLPLVTMVRHQPGELDELPDGDPHANASRDDPTCGTAFSEQPNRARGPERDADMTARAAMRTPAFWLISAGHALALLTVSAVMVHLVAHLTEDIGYSLAAAGGVVAVLTAFQVVGQVTGGYLGDRVNKRYICAACMLAHTAGLLLVTYAFTPWMVLGFVVLHGLAWGIRGPLMVALRADYFGTSSFGTIMGFSTLIVMLGMSGGPLMAGTMADLSGSYESGFTLIALLSLLGAFCFLAALPPPRARL